VAASKLYRDMVIGDLMSPEPVTVRPGNTLVDIEEIMKLSDVRHLPVVDGSNRVVGILSNRDLARGTGRSKQGIVAADVMTQDVLTVRATTRLCEGSALMLEYKIGALPVVDRDDALIGIVTETDYLRIAHEICGGDELAVDED
jgi:CBS domain-containing membrane protein